MSDHPEIPPNCVHFLIVDGKEVFSAIGMFPKDPTLWDRFGWPWPLDPVRPYQVPIIAAVARCAWLDFADERQAALSNTKYTQEQVAEVNIECQKIQDAVNNAEAWRAWAEGK